MKTLLVYYSETDHTAKAAASIAACLDADVERLTLKQPLSYWRKGAASWCGDSVALKPPTKNPQDYDLVVIGTPVWAWHLSAPVHTYVKAHKDHLQYYAALITCGGSGSEKARHTLEQIIGRRAIAHVVLTDKDRRSKRDEVKIADFISHLEKQIERYAPPAKVAHA